MHKLCVFLRIPKKINKTYVEQTETISHSTQWIWIYDFFSLPLSLRIFIIKTKYILSRVSITSLLNKICPENCEGM